MNATTVQNNLSTLRKGGPCGLVTVLLGLKWWWADDSHAKRWEEAIADLDVCFKHFEEAPVIKRKNPGGDEKKRKRIKTA